MLCDTQFKRLQKEVEKPYQDIKLSCILYIVVVVYFYGRQMIFISIWKDFDIVKPIFMPEFCRQHSSEVLPSI